MNFDPHYLNSQYNNRARVKDFQQHLNRWTGDSAVARNMQACLLDIAYGEPAQAETLDIFPAGGSAQPVLVFIHGGWWRSLDKADHAFVAPAFTEAGACVVLTNYPLCPNVTIEQIVLSQVKALAWVYRNIEQYGGDPSRITVAGHSAGGHLAAMMLGCQWTRWEKDLPARLVKNALSLSGLHDLEAVLHTLFLQADLRLNASQVARCSPARFAAPAGELVALCGGDESQEFHRQNALIQQAWGKKTVRQCEALPGLNHFSVLEALATPGHAAQAALLRLLKSSKSRA